MIAIAITATNTVNKDKGQDRGSTDRVAMLPCAPQDALEPIKRLNQAVVLLRDVSAQSYC